HPHRHFSYLNFRAGVGQHSQMPPLAFLYPAPTYVDLVSLMHYSNNADARTVLFTTHILDDTKSLKPASNLKKEVGVDFTVYGIHTQITFYQEELKNAFSQEIDYTWLNYKKYDTNGIATDSKPDPAQLPYHTTYYLAPKGQVNNKNRLEKTGIEYRIDFGRIHPIYTDIIVDGAWKKTLQYKYINEYAPAVVSTNQIEAIGHYHDQLHSTLQLSQFSSKLHLVTHVPQLRWVFSGSFQFIWIDKRISQFYPLQPKALQTEEGNRPFTDEMASQPDYTRFALKAKTDVKQSPFLFSSNLRLSKEIGNAVKLSVFVNNFLNYRPFYLNDGNLYERKNNTTNFGAEIILKL
ncbi:MAG: TonB-dependent receptor, partial [Marinilabiliaceae bacterium]|nr:TonB-dependent receptor [Marinilabiliaceae bacterium]